MPLGGAWGRFSGRGVGFDPPPCALTITACQFVPMPWHDRYSYHEALARHWGAGSTLVNIEHDMELSLALIESLVSCPQPLCTHAYRMHLPRPCWAHGWALDDGRRARGEGVRWIAEGEEWADYSAIGFCKITPEARTGKLARCEWPAVELAVNNATTGLWHVHWPAIKHYHEVER